MPFSAILSMLGVGAIFANQSLYALTALTAWSSDIINTIFGLLFSVSEIELFWANKLTESKIKVK